MAGIADDQARDFDFEKTEMKYDSTGMFHWSPARSLDECILVKYSFYWSTRLLNSSEIIDQISSRLLEILVKILQMY